MIEISDMYLAATLLAYGAELKDINRSNPRRLQFHFSDEVKEIWVESGHIHLRIETPNFEIIEKHFIGTTLVYPPKFIDCIKKVKSAIHGV